jgi:hypothetical protein
MAVQNQPNLDGCLVTCRAAMAWLHLPDHRDEHRLTASGRRPLRALSRRLRVGMALAKDGSLMASVPGMAKAVACRHLPGALPHHR